MSSILISRYIAARDSRRKRLIVRISIDAMFFRFIDVIIFPWRTAFAISERKKEVIVVKKLTAE